MDGDRRFNTKEGNLKVNIFLSVMDTILLKLRTRFNGTREVMEMFSFLNLLILTSNPQHDIIKAPYDFVIKYNNDIISDFTRKIISSRSILLQHQLNAIRNQAI